MFGIYDRYFFIDESGNLGTGDRYFVIALVETKKPMQLHRNVKRHLLATKIQFPGIKAGSHEIKASHSNPVAKDYFYRNVVKGTRVSYIVLDKKHLEPVFLADKNRAYNYLLKLLFDKMNIRKNESFFIGLDNKTIKVSSLNSFEDYINIHFNYERCLNNNIGVKYIDSDSRYGYPIQAADYFANAIWTHYEHKYSLFYDLIKPSINAKLVFPLCSFGK